MASPVAETAASLGSNVKKALKLGTKANKTSKRALTTAKRADKNAKDALAKAGKAGPPGAQGVQGPQGPSDAFSAFKNGAVAVPNSLGAIATLGSLPAGKYAIVAKAWFEDLSTGSSAVLMQCQLTAGGDTDTTRFELEDADDSQAAQVMAVPFNVVHEFSSTGTVTLDCSDFGVNVQAHDMKITATKVGNLSNVASP